MDLDTLLKLPGIQAAIVCFCLLCLVIIICCCLYKLTSVKRTRSSYRARNTNHRKKSQVKIIDLISEGPIEGFCSQNGETISYFGKSDAGRGEVLQSVYFDGTKVLNPDLGTLNYRLANVHHHHHRHHQ